MVFGKFQRWESQYQPKREKDIFVTRLGWDKEKFRGFKQIIYMKLEQEEGRKNDQDGIAETLC